MKSLQTKILTLLLGSVILASFLIAGAGIINSQRAIDEDSAQIVALTCEETAREIDQTLLSIEQSVQTDYSYADSLLSEDEALWRDEAYMEQYMAQVRTVLMNTVNNTDDAVSIYLRFNPEIIPAQYGVFLSKTGGQKEFYDTPLTDIMSYAPDDREHVGWYYEPIANGEPTWMEPYENRNIGVYMISYIIPIFRGDTPVAVIGMDLDVELLKRTVQNLTVYETGYAFLAEKNGDMVYHKEYPDGIAVENFDDNLKNLGKVLGDAKEAGRIYSYKWHGQKKMMMFRPLVNGMYLIISAPASEIDASRNVLILQCVLILFFVLLATTLLSVKMVGKITKPLRELTNAAGKIAAGDWNVSIHSDSKDEVGVLARTLDNTIGELKQYIESVNRLAYTDVMTGLYNRHYLNEYGCRTFNVHKGTVGVIFCDLNRLKYTNDHFGHAAGDRLIIGFGEILRECFPENMCCRMSGDEYVVCVLDVSKAEFAKLLQLLREHNVEEEIPIAAIGSCWREKADNLDVMLTEAENAMYQDKQIFYDKFPEYRR